MILCPSGDVLAVPNGWQNTKGVLRPIQSPPPSPKMCSFICRNCGKETVYECCTPGLVPFDLGCAHCAEYALEYNGELPGKEERWPTTDGDAKPTP